MRCYFHLVNGHEMLLDDTGVEVSGLEVAEAEALKAIQDLREEEGEAEDWQGWQLHVTDWAGHVLLAIPLDAAPQQRSRRFSQAAPGRMAQLHGLLIGACAGIDCLNLLLG